MNRITRNALCAGLLLLTVLHHATNLSAATWTGNTNTDWFTATNWTGGVPTAGTTGDFNDPDPAVINGVAVASQINMTQGSLNLNSGSLTVSGLSQMGQGAFNPTFNQTGGDVFWNAGGLYVGNIVGSGADIYTYGGGNFTAAQLTIRGEGQFDHNNSVNPMNVGSGGLSVASATGNHVFNLNGNVLNLGGKLTIGTGSNTGSSSFNFGAPTTAKLTFTSASGAIDVNGTNTFTVPNLTNSLTIPGQSIIGGVDGFSVFTQQGGAVDFNGNLYVSNANDGKKDQYNFNGGTLQAQMLTVYQWGEFNHNASTELDVVTDFNLGTSSTGNSFFNLNGNQVKVGGSLNVGTAGTGTGTFNFGSPTTAKLTITSGGLNVGGTNTFTVPNLTNPLTVPGQSIVGGTDGFSVFTQNGGAVDFNGNFYISNLDDGKKDQYNFNGGTLQTQLLTVYQWGEFNHNTSAELDVVTDLNLGTSSTGNSFFNLNGNQVKVGGSLNVGTAGTGTGTFNFGSPTTAKLTITSGGINVGGTNTFTVPNLTNPLTVPGQSIVGGTNGFSVFTQNGGAVDFNGNLYISNLDDSKKDQYNFNGGTLQVQNMIVYQWGEFNQNNASSLLDIVTSLSLGNSTTGNSFFNMNGHEVKIGGNLELGTANNTGSGTFTFGNPATAKLTINGGINIYGKSTLVIPAGLVNPIVVPGQTIIGQGSGGESIYQQDGGTVSFNGQFYIANVANAGGETDKVIVNGGTLNLNGVSSNINLQTRGAIIVNGGTLNAKTFNIGNVAGYIAGFQSTGGTSNFAGTVKLDNVGDSDVDYINISGGTVNITGAGNDLELHGTSTASISGGLVNVVDDFLVGTRTAHVAIVNQTGGRVVVGDRFEIATVAGATGTYNLSGGELKVGTLDLTNLGSDAFNLNGGKLSAVVVDNADSIFSFTSGMLSPGLVNTPATMTFNTGLTIPAAGGLQMDLYLPNTLGGGNDLLVVNGNLVLDGILSVNSDVPVGTFPFLTFTGTLNDQGMQVLFPLTQSIFIQLNQGGGGTVFLSVIPVPEPSSMLLLAGMGLIGLQARRRTRCAA